MNLAKLPRGVEVFVDASILALHFIEQGALTDQCSAFLSRCTVEELRAYTSVIVAAETIPRVIGAGGGRRDGS